MASNRRKPTDVIEEFEQEYADLLAETAKAQETTATVGWQQLYVEFMRANQRAREEAAGLLEVSTDALQNGPLDADGVKMLKGAVKDAEAACEAAASFDAQTVRPLRKTVEALHRLVADFEGRANSAAAVAPLTDSELPDQMAEAIARQTKASWNPRTGTIALQQTRAV